MSKFPIADGVYYKVNYAPGTDISRYKNIPVPTSYMAYHSDLDFIGNYDHFEGDLNKKNQVHCCLMATQGHLGKNEKEQAKQLAAQGLELDACHYELTELLKSCS